MLMPSGTRSRKQKGASIVEGTLVLLTTFTFVLFTMEMGRVLLVEQFYQERAREGARAASVNSWTTSQVQNYVCYNQTTGSGSGLLGLNPSSVTVSTLGTSGYPDYRVQVKIAGVSLVTFIPGFNSYTTAPVVATMPIQSQGATN